MNESIKGFFTDDPDELVLAFINAHCTGRHPFAITLMPDDQMVIGYPDRAEFYVFRELGRENIEVRHFDDAMVLFEDPDADAEDAVDYPSIKDAFIGTCKLIGFSDIAEAA